LLQAGREHPKVPTPFAAVALRIKATNRVTAMIHSRYHTHAIENTLPIFRAALSGTVLTGRKFF
tara:strand:+ start:513 stop:704 length:192 start_codon:yes stop_codon:yes gene_type:complete